MVLIDWGPLWGGGAVGAFFFFAAWPKKKRRANIFPAARFCFFNGGFEVRGRKRKSCWGVHGHPEPALGAIGRIFSDFPDFPEKYF